VVPQVSNIDKFGRIELAMSSDIFLSRYLSEEESGLRSLEESFALGAKKHNAGFLS
jgi:hypothetical protein